MTTTKVRVDNFEFSFTDEDIVNPDDFIPKGESNPHNVRPWLFHDHGFTLCVVFADCLQDAMDEAVDADKLDCFMIDLTSESERNDYLTSNWSEADAGLDENCAEWTAPDGTKYWWKLGMTPVFLGNAGEPFDLDTLEWVELPNPPMSICALFNSAQEGK